MKSIRLLVRDAARAMLGSLPPPWAGAVVGALAADPETIEELDAAMQRFQLEAPLEKWRESFVESDEDLEPDDWGAVIDLPTRLIFWSGGPGPDEGATSAPVLDKGELTQVELSYELLPTWQVVTTRDGWRERVEAARETQREHPPIDVRAVLYDQLADWLANALCSDRFVNADDPVAAIHAGWLATPRDDLAGRSPRDVLIADQEWIEQEMHWRCGEWSRLGRAPIPVSRETRAYRFGGIGLHEFIMYYDLVRHLLSRAWEEQPGDFRDPEMLADWLRHEQRRWLLNPVHEGTPDAYIPGEVIDLERQRVPMTIDPEAAMIDCDCPLCQMMAEENFGPTFVHFDTIHFDLEFVFSSYKTQRDWEFEVGLGDEHPTDDDDDEDEEDANDSDDSKDSPSLPGDESPRTVQVSGPFSWRVTPMAMAPLMQVGQPYRENLVEMLEGATDATGELQFRQDEIGTLTDGPSAEQLWRNSRVTTPSSNASHGFRLQTALFEVAAHAIELRDDVRESAEHRQWMERVIEDFANLRAAMRQQDLARVGRLTEQCVDALNALGVARPAVGEKCADLEKSFRRLEKTICERPSELPRDRLSREIRRRK